MATTKILPWIVSAMLISSVGSAFAQSNEDNWLGVDGTTWRNGDNTLCWRDAFWTPATANAQCDGALQAATSLQPVGQPSAQPVTVTTEKVTYAADTFFDFDKAVLKPGAKEVLDEMVRRLQNVELEVIVTTGHTDSVGPAAYNQKLSLRRAEAVKAYLVNRGIPADRIFVEGKGETAPVATNSTRAGRAQNRRVEIEVVGTVTRR